MTDYRFEYIKNQITDELLVEQQKSNDEKIQQLKEDIAINKEKLQKLEELQRTKSPLEIAYKDWCGQYPETGNWDSNDDTRWAGFQAGYNASKVSETPQTPKQVNTFAPKEMEELIRESVKWCEEHPNESLEDYLTPQERGNRIHKEVENKLQEKNWYVAEENEWKTVALLFGKKLPVIPPYGYDELSPNSWYRWVVFNYDNYIKQRDIESKRYPTPPQTPEQIEKSLREAFKKVQQTEEWKETQRKIDAPIDKLLKKWEENPPDFLRFELGKTLEERIYKWWETCFVQHPEWSMDECVEDLLDIIELHLPREQNSQGTQRIETEIAVEAHNELLQKIKSKLRNNKDT